MSAKSDKLSKFGFNVVPSGKVVLFQFCLVFRLFPSLTGGWALVAVRPHVCPEKRVGQVSLCCAIHPVNDLSRVS